MPDSLIQILEGLGDSGGSGCNCGRKPSSMMGLGADANATGAEATFLGITMTPVVAAGLALAAGFAVDKLRRRHAGVEIHRGRRR